MIVHGGAGIVVDDLMTSEMMVEVRAALRQAVLVGYDSLVAGGTALDAVILATKILEDNPYFNAGKGSVYNREGFIEMDAGVMDGTTGKVGSLSGLQFTKNPVEAAAAVLAHNPHPVLASTGGEAWARAQGLPMAAGQEYFFTQYRWDQLEGVRAAAVTVESKPVRQLDQPGLNFLTKLNSSPDSAIGVPVSQAAPLAVMGTAGAVSLDNDGQLASASSTGGLTGQHAGRVSSAAIPGAGFWADNTVAVSMTGKGDGFTRNCAAYDIAARMKYGRVSLSKATQDLIHGHLRDNPGGLIAVDHMGNWEMPYNTVEMYRGVMCGDMKEPIILVRDS
jgi:beta-aspartyl-peptidase (threonine type)